MGMSVRTAGRTWTSARAWLRRQICGQHTKSEQEEKFWQNHFCFSACYAGGMQECAHMTREHEIFLEAREQPSVAGLTRALK
jgi:hypothetical protein